MARLRVKTATSQNTGKIYAELYYPAEEIVPIATTEPIYPNSEEAVKYSVEMFKEWMTLSAEEQRNN